LRDREAEAPAVLGAAPCRPPPGGVPELDEAVRDRLALPVEQHPRELDAPWLEHALVAAAQPHRVIRANCLRRRARQRHRPSSSGVVPRPPRPSTMSHLNPSAHSGSVVSMSKLAIMSARALGSRTAVEIGSYGISGSPGKYIWVTSRSVNSRPN